MCSINFLIFFESEKTTKSSSPQKLVVSNYHGTLDVGVAFQLLLRDLPVRRGIIMSVDPMTKALGVWYQSKSVKRGPGESQDLFGMYDGFLKDDIPTLTISPIPGVFDSWLSRVPAQVRIACGHVRASGRARPEPKVGARAASNNLIHPDLVSSPGCSPPRSLSPSEDVKSNVKKNRVPPITSQLAQVCVALDMMDNKLDVILHKLKKMKKE